MKLSAAIFLLTFKSFSAPLFAAPVCALGTVSCFLACGEPPSILNASQAVAALRSEPYERLTWLDRSAALLTTPLGKCLGINGWRRYSFQVSAAGKVDQAASSWDGLRTIDIAVESFDGSSIDTSHGHARYLRAEVVRSVWKSLNHPPRQGDRIEVHGELNWDGHGFLELHPLSRGDIRLLPNATTGS